MTRAERLRLIRERLDNHDVQPFQTARDKGAAKSNRDRRKGEAFQKLIAADILRIAQPYGFSEGDIYSRSITGHGDDILFSPPAFYRFGFPRMECKHYCRSADFESIFRKHAQHCTDRPEQGQVGIPVLVYRCDYQPVQATMRQEDLKALSKTLDRTWQQTGELVTLPWQNLLQLLSRRIAAFGPLEPSFEVEGKIEF